MEPEFEDDEEEEAYMAAASGALSKYEFWFELDKSIIGGGVEEDGGDRCPRCRSIKLRLVAAEGLFPAAVRNATAPNRRRSTLDAQGWLRAHRSITP